MAAMKRKLVVKSFEETLLKKNSTPKPSLVKELVKMFMKHVKCMSQIIISRLLGSIGKSNLEIPDQYSVELKVNLWTKLAGFVGGHSQQCEWSAPQIRDPDLQSACLVQEPSHNLLKKPRVYSFMNPKDLSRLEKLKIKTIISDFFSSACQNEMKNWEPGLQVRDGQTSFRASRIDQPNHLLGAEAALGHQQEATK